jgi:hypothetical protein
MRLLRTSEVVEECFNHKVPSMMLLACFPNIAGATESWRGRFIGGNSIAYHA